MGYRIVVASDAIGRDEPQALAIAYEEMGYWLEALVKSNRAHLRRFPTSTPRLYLSGVRYDPMDPPEGSACGDDDWAVIARCLATIDPQTGRGKADCEDLACWRVAELQEIFHINAVPHVFLRREWEELSGQQISRGQHLYHIVVRWPAGLDRYPNTVRRFGDLLIEDPSLVLGMGRESR